MAPLVVATSITVGRFAVSVPVLSSATPRILPSASSAAPPLTNAPSLLAAPIAATTVTGTEIAKAHGEAATSTTRARSIQVAGSPSTLPSTAISAAAIMTPGTSGLAMRSAKRWEAPLRDCSASTMRTMRASELSSAVVVTSTSSTPVPLIDPANTSSPGPASTGTDSPVMAETSSAVRPCPMMPSVATRSPGLTSIRSPIRNSVGATTISVPSRSTVASSGTSDNSARSPRRVRASEYSSSPSLMENRKASMAASPTSPRITAPTAAMVIRVPTPILPLASRVRVDGTKV
ncbi:Uncharacterised protein [Mycobacteroides abscessus subsp. abscessus]|nr:Uncharacterised protein [Mycobacteroides abscessus subsp. abscessus]